MNTVPLHSAHECAGAEAILAILDYDTLSLDGQITSSSIT